jgi:beta-phosphoglucomutase-like phosphatase (HAD superfamily)
VLGLPDPVAACLFDLDGVLTQTARLHAAARKEMFDGYLRRRSERTGEPFVPFRLPDYDNYVDGRPRADGTRMFLRSRGIVLPDGGGTDTVTDGTVRGLGNTKNAIVLRKLAASGVEVYPGSVRYMRAARAAGLARAVVSASTNCRDVLAAAGIGDLRREGADVVITDLADLLPRP